MKIILGKILTLLLVSTLFISCAKESDDDDSNGGGGSSISASEPSSLFDAATNAVTSSYSESSSNLVGFSAITCEDGAPTSSSEGDANFAGEDVYCVLNSNSKSPDTVQGSYYIVSKILCAIEKTESFEYASTATEHNGITLNENDSCFGDDGFDATDDGDTNDSFVISITEQAITGSDYDYYIGIQLGASSFSSADIKLYLKDSDNIIAARMYQESDESQIEFVLDSNTNSMYFENRDYGNTRHIRIASVGTFGSDGTFSSVTQALYIHTEGTEGASSGEMAVMMHFDGSSDSYDHYVNSSQDSDYSNLSSITYNSDFYTWSGRDITDLDPESDSILDLSSFDMSF